jgi:hypothetical protein
MLAGKRPTARHNASVEAFMDKKVTCLALREIIAQFARNTWIVRWGTAR